jgi:hypothetical protein
MGCTASQPRAQDERTANLVLVGARDDDSLASASEWRIAHTGNRVLLCHKYLTLVLPLHSCAIAMWVHGPSDANKPLRQSWLYCRDPQSGPPCSVDAIFAEDDLQPELAPLTDTVPIGSWFIRHLGEFVFRFDYLVKGQLAVVNPTDPLYLKRNGLSGCGVTMLWGDLSQSPSSKTGATDDLSNPNLFKTSVAAGSSWCVAMTDDCVLLSHRYLTLVLPHNTTRFAMWVHGPADEGGVAAVVGGTPHDPPERARFRCVTPLHHGDGTPFAAANAQRAHHRVGVVDQPAGRRRVQLRARLGT